jgi:hypothetical protein
MKNWFLCVLLVVSVPCIAAADEIEIESTGATTIIGSGTGITTPVSINGWTITSVTGVSSSPGLSPFGIDLTVDATCTSGACLTTPLEIFYSATGFNASVSAGGFQTTYSATVTGSGNTNEIAWANNTNTLLALGASNKIGAGVGPFSAPGGFGTSTGGPGQVSATPYSLTIEDVLTAGTSGSSSFSTDANLTGNLTAVPEPSSLVLLGLGLLVMIPLKRRTHAIDS